MRAPDPSRPRLSEWLRAQTRIAHEAAEAAPFVRHLLAGELPLSAYAALVAQNHAIYGALEAAARSWRGHPVAGAFVLDELTRGPHLAADLAQLLGADWRSAAAGLRCPATDRYVGRLRRLATSSPAVFVAHHYVRYLGDLSGGQVIRAVLARHYGSAGAAATSFYVFDGIEAIKPFRDRYRQALDSAPLTEPQRRQVVAEAVTAFELNRAVFDDLAGRLPGQLSQPRAAGVPANRSSRNENAVGA